jgi:hypothetical protein
MSSTSSRHSSWDTASVHDDDKDHEDNMDKFKEQEVPDMDLYEQEETTIGISLESVVSCLRTQGYALANLVAAVRQPDSDDMTGRNSPFSKSKAANLKERYRVWKEERQTLFRFMKDLETKLDEEIFDPLFAKEARSQCRQLSGPSSESGRVISIEHADFKRPRQTSKLAQRATSEHRAFPYTSTSSRQLEKSELTRPESAPPIPDRHPSHRISSRSTPGGAEVSLCDILDGFTPPNLLPEEHRERAEKRKQLLLRGGEGPVRKMSPASPVSYVSGILPKTPSSSNSHAKLPSTSSLLVLYEDLQAAGLVDSIPRASLVNVDTSRLSQSSRTQNPQQISFQTTKRSSSLGLRLDIPSTPPDSGRRSHLPEIYPSRSGYFRDILDEPPNLRQSSLSDLPSAHPAFQHPPSQMSDLHVSPASLSAQQAKEVQIQSQLAHLEQLKMATRHAEMNLVTMRNGELTARRELRRRIQPLRCVTVAEWDRNARRKDGRIG